MALFFINQKQSKLADFLLIRHFLNNSLQRKP